MGSLKQAEQQNLTFIVCIFLFIFLQPKTPLSPGWCQPNIVSLMGNDVVHFPVMMMHTLQLDFTVPAEASWEVKNFVSFAMDVIVIFFSLCFIL